MKGMGKCDGMWGEVWEDVLWEVWVSVFGV